MELVREAEDLFVSSFDASKEWFLHEEYIRRHSEVLAEAARKVAQKMQENGVNTVDPEMAYVCGLTHDIGKTVKGWYGLDHPVKSYRILKERGWEDAARVAMTHTYYGYKEIDRSEFWEWFEDPEDLKFTREYMETVELTDLDLLIQLLDNMAHQSGMMTIADRFADILIRHNLKHAGQHLKELYRLKSYFDEKCGMNIYKMFEDDIIRAAMQEPNGPIDEDLVREKGKDK